MDENPVPEELQQELGDIMHRIAIAIHRETTAQGVIIQVDHVSDSVNKAAYTLCRVAINVDPDKIKKATEPVDKAAMVDDAIKKSMAAAKSKAGVKVEAPKAEAPKDSADEWLGGA
jgi:hypothetical protein